MVRLGGYEIVALEIAEALYERGFRVHIRTNSLSDRVIRSSLAPVDFSDSDDLLDLCEFDFVWMQHNMVAHLNMDKLVHSDRLPAIVSAHLSPFEMFELVGVGFALLVGAKLVSNSDETKARLVSMGVESRDILNFKNAAPKRFAPTTRSLPGSSLSKLLVVSNHIPSEIRGAISLLRKRGVASKIIGLGELERRVTESDVQEADAVLTIGKTVQYALLSGRPVFCYDHFGGPGWLTRENFERACYYNFSGRCCGKKDSSEAIFKALLLGYEKAAKEAIHFQEEVSNEFLIDRYLDSLVSSGPHVFSESSLRMATAHTYFANSWKLRIFYRRIERLESRQRFGGFFKRCVKVIRDFLR